VERWNSFDRGGEIHPRLFIYEESGTGRYSTSKNQKLYSHADRLCAEATGRPMGKTRVLIVDDSALVRQMLAEILGSDRDIEVVGTAADPYIAREKIKKLHPDVLTLDVEMPRMDGITFLGNLMRLRPMPVVMVSSLTENGAEVTFRALEVGAVDFVAKPKLDVARGLEGYAAEIIEKVKMAATVQVTRLEAARWERLRQPRPAAGPKLRSTNRHFRTTDQVIAVGASTGGTEAVKAVLSLLPADAPGMVITQHIPAAFSGPFARRMNEHSAMTVMEAEDGLQLVPGHAYIAPGDQHLEVVRDGARYVCRLNRGAPVNRHRPSVDVLFHSVASNVGPNAIGVILTGMGADGAKGLGALQRAGAPTIAQDEATSVVWGMPGEAVHQGAADLVLPLDQIAGRILQLADRRRPAVRA